MNKLLFLSFTIAVFVAGSACKARKEQSGTKFIAYARESGPIFLISKVHNDVIRYAQKGEKCDRPKQKIPSGKSLELAIQTWIDVVKSAASEGKVALVSDKFPTFEEIPYEQQQPFADIKVVFHCEVGRSYAHVFAPYAMPIVHAFASSKPDWDFWPYEFTNIDTILLHEVGHAFGLGDLYIDGSANPQQRQPEKSVMNDPYRYKIQPDDIEGLIHLYKFYVSKEIDDLKSCPTGYKYEANGDDIEFPCAPSDAKVF
ncbi:MAG: hypothetical protein AB7T49_04225 [Oligoflexales bacterium]